MHSHMSWLVSVLFNGTVVDHKVLKMESSQEGNVAAVCFPTLWEW